MSEENDEEYYESLADAIRSLSAHVRELKESGLNEKGIIILLHHYTKIPQRKIKAVLDAMDELEDYYGEES